MKPSKKTLTFDARGLAECLRHTRSLRGLTLREAADECGVGHATLARIERETTIPRADTLAKVADLCDAWPTWFFFAVGPDREGDW